MSLGLAVLPNALIGLHLSLNGLEAAKIVQLASMTTDGPESVVPYNLVYMTCWAVLCVAMLLVALAYIPYHLENSRQNSAAIKVNSVARILPVGHFFAAESGIPVKSLGSDLDPEPFLG